MTADARGNPMSSGDEATVTGFELAMRQYQSYVGDALATIDGVLAAHPDFVMGHVFRTGLLMTFAEARFTAMARESQAVAERLAERANARERALIAATHQLVSGEWDAACAAFNQVLVDYPRDAFAIQTAHLFDFLRGDAKNLRDRITRVLPAWSESVPGFSFVLGMHAFGLEESNQYAEAASTARRALAIEPRDAWAIHAVVHCHEMQGQIDDGIAFLEQRRAGWFVDNGFAFHNSWHLALFHLDRGDTQKVWEVLDSAILPEPLSDGAYQLVDATALLWRLYLAGVDVRARAERIADVWATKTGEPGFYAFNDVHAVLAFVMSERPAGELLTAIPRTAVGRDVGVPLAQAAVAFGEKRYDHALALLQDVRDRAHRFGGSHAQRDLVTLTLVEAALRGGRTAAARHFLAERLVQRPLSGLGARLAARAS